MEKIQEIRDGEEKQNKPRDRKGNTERLKQKWVVGQLQRY